jgi:hypothetical protein
MELIITLGLGGWAILIVGSLIFGVIAQFVGDTRDGYEWLTDSIAAAGVISDGITKNVKGLRTYGIVR